MTRRLCGRPVRSGALLTLLAAVAAGQESPEPEASPTPRRPGLAVSIEPVLDRMEAEAVEAELRADPDRPLRFETAIEVRAKTPEQLLARFLDGPETRLAPAPGAPPSVREMDEQRAFGDGGMSLLPLVGVLADWLGGDGEPRYFLYRAIRANGEVRPLLRERPLPPALLIAGPDGTRFEAAGSFASRSEAVNAYRRLEANLTRERREREIRASPAPTPRP